MKRSVGILMLVPTLLIAQRTERACIPPHTPDSLTVVVGAQVTSFDTSVTLPPSFTGLFLQEISNRLRPPTPFVLSTYQGLDSLDGLPTPGRAYAGAFAMFAITVRDKTVKGGLSASSGVPGIDRAFIDAINRVGADSATPPLPAELRKSRVELRLRVFTAVGVADGDALFRVRVPLATLSHPVALKATRGALRYPEELRRENMEGSVLLSFVVDEQGRPLDGSVRLVKATHALFAQAVLGFLPKQRFEPARIGGCPVAQLVQWPFNFSLR
jgi:TonB family protein